MPVALLGRLAAHRKAQGQGVGKRLLRDALHRVADVSGQIGCLGVVVDAKDEVAEGFYARFGFVTLPGVAWPRRMFLSMETLRAAL
jgi:GNAT superfamily N-acetyltransferase